MRSKIILSILLTCVGLSLLVWGCGKDDKSTSPEDNTPSVTVTLGGTELSFGSIGGYYNTGLNYLIVGFSQSSMGGYPTTAITVSRPDTLQLGISVECGAAIYTDSSTAYVCGSLAQNDSAVVSISFTRMELNSGGRVSGDVTGLLEHRYHSNEPLVPVEMHFRNIPLE